MDRMAVWAVTIRSRRYGIRIARRLPRACFTPPPRVDAALVTVLPYPMSLKMERRLAELLAAADHHPGPAATVPPECWRALVMR
jgi:16S rRNA A1518/A1519 N6-dimethyltransferase RsmA/KsgA/DIM1 with predicted DNA glycosylase/AP lyase activity